MNDTEKPHCALGITSCEFCYWLLADGECSYPKKPAKEEEKIDAREN